MKCSRVNGHYQASSLHSRFCCYTPDVCFLSRRANLSYNEGEGHGSSTALAAFLEEVSNFHLFRLDFWLHSMMLGLLTMIND